MKRQERNIEPPRLPTLVWHGVIRKTRIGYKGRLAASFDSGRPSMLVSGPKGDGVVGWWFRFTREGIQAKLRRELQRNARRDDAPRHEEIYRPRQEYPNE